MRQRHAGASVDGRSLRRAQPPAASPARAQPQVRVLTPELPPLIAGLAVWGLPALHRAAGVGCDVRGPRSDVSPRPPRRGPRPSSLGELSGSEIGSVQTRSFQIDIADE